MSSIEDVTGSPPASYNSTQSATGVSLPSCPTLPTTAAFQIPRYLNLNSYPAFEVHLEEHFLQHMAKMGEVLGHDTVLNTTNRSFMTLRHIYSGPNAKIILGDDEEREEWELPKMLLMYHSNYFLDALAPTIGIDDGHTIYFEAAISDSFAAMVRLMYTGSVCFDKAPSSSDQITNYLNFFHLGERLEIEWARTKIDTISVLVEGLLATDKDALTSAHVHSAFTLDASHPMQLFIAEMCYKHYLMTDDDFKFWKEWSEIPQFAKVLLQASKNVAIEANAVKNFEKLNLTGSDDEGEEHGFRAKHIKKNSKDGNEKIELSSGHIKKQSKEESGWVDGVKKSFNWVDGNEKGPKPMWDKDEEVKKDTLIKEESDNEVSKFGAWGNYDKFVKDFDPKLSD